MKRIALLSIAIVVALLGSACERFPAAELSDHYKHKIPGHAHHEAAGTKH